ncbi:hypothetical protein VNO77_08284 [Canavalia gladiata]|uniref:Uncharacterized protein n=1 Tax=Canavalia gladiata TaxID=3824 RepID=A0AAN9QWJ5_CANGL
MGDLLGNPRVAPPPFCVSRACSFGGAGWFPHPAAPILGVGAKAPEGAPEEAGFLTRRLRSLALLQQLRKGPRNRLVSSPGGSDPWRCCKSSEEGPGTGWFPHPAAPILGVAAKAPKRAPEKVSGVEADLNRPSPVGLVLSVGQAGFLTRRLRSLALLQKLRKGPRTRLVSSPGGSDPWRCCKSTEKGPGTVGLVLSVGQAGFLTRRLRSLALLQKLRKGPRTRLVSSPGGSDPWRCCKSSEKGPRTVGLVLLVGQAGFLTRRLRSLALLQKHRKGPRNSRACSFGGGSWFPHPAAPILGVAAKALKRALEQSSTGMGDLLGNPRVAPPPFCVSRACSFGGAGWFPHPAAPILGVAAKAPERAPEQSSTRMGDLLGNPRVAPPPFCVSRACSFGRAGWFPHPAAPILGVAAKTPKRAPEQR